MFTRFCTRENAAVIEYVCNYSKYINMIRYNVKQYNKMKTKNQKYNK